MEDKALEILRVMLARRGLDTKTERVVAAELDRVNLYTIGKMLVVFSQKDKGVLDKDITTFRKFAEANDYTNGLVVVSLMPPSENVLRSIKSQAVDRLQFFHIRQLQVDIFAHRLVVPHRILKEEERMAMFKTYNIVNAEEQLPWIDSQDAPVKWIGAIPGDVIEIMRHSDVAGTVAYYRYCGTDVNVA
jgi:DNA-directed RNA polymerase subunit H (RpoH/RPB5)